MTAFRRERSSTPELPRFREFRAVVLVAFVCLGIAAAFPRAALAIGPNAVMTPGGYNANLVARGDDTSNLVVNLPFTMTWNGTTYSQIYINMNGNCTFGGGFTGYDPNDSTLAGSNQNIMAPFWADVDSRNVAAAQVSYSNITSGSVPTVNGRKAFFVNWVGVACYNNQSAPTNSFQLVIVDRSDTGAGNFDFIYNYDQIAWDIGTAASTRKARVGWGRAGTGYELPGSGTAQASASTLLDSSTQAQGSLIKNSLNSSGQLGRYLWSVRGGLAPNIPPAITVINRVLEGNAAGGYSGWNGSADATATSPDDGIAALTCNRVFGSFLPLGTTTVTWNATDTAAPASRVGTATATQTIVVTDTTAPTNPNLSSPTHATGVWSTNPTVTVNWAGATDVCSGVSAYSYSWSQNATSDPGTVVDPATSTVTVAPGQGSWYFNIRTVDGAGNWSATRSMGPFDIDTVKPTTVDNAPAGWSKTSVLVTLTASDPSGPVAWTKYKLNAGAVTTYTVPIAVAIEGTSTLQYWSQDMAGNSETTHTITIRVDTVAPTIPGSPWASSADTHSVDVTWTVSADVTSGMFCYNVYRNGSLVGTTSSTLYTDIGLTAGQTYSYYVRAQDLAGNLSTASATVTETVPPAGIWMQITNTTVTFPSVDPGVASNVSSATIVSIGSVGAIPYDLSCAASDFSNIATASPTPTMTVSVMSFATRGYKVAAAQPFSTTPVTIDTGAVGQKYRWQHDYVFDLTLTPPWAINPGTYTSGIVYTAVPR